MEDVIKKIAGRPPTRWKDIKRRAGMNKVQNREFWAKIINDNQLTKKKINR